MRFYLRKDSCDPETVHVYRSWGVEVQRYEIVFSISIHSISAFFGMEILEAIEETSEIIQIQSGGGFKVV